MIKNTNCQRCIFSKRANENQSCEHGIIDYVKDIKNISVEDDYYVIHDYVCKMGFNKDIYESNKEKLSLEEIKQEIVNRACVRYYLLMDITSVTLDQMKEICDYLKNMSIKPVFISFIMFKNDNDTEKLKILRNNINDEFMWKVHAFIENISIDDAIHIAIDTNYGKNNSQYLLIYDPEKIDQLDRDINEINMNIIITQKPMHYGRKSTKDSILDGLFLTFNNYQICRSINKEMSNALDSIPDAIVLEYGKN